MIPLTNDDRNRGTQSSKQILSDLLNEFLTCAQKVPLGVIILKMFVLEIRSTGAELRQNLT